MARPPRLELAGVPLHIVQRGVNRAACFFADADRRFYLSCLAKAAGKRGVAVHAYVLMSNHVHLLVTPYEKGAVSAVLQDVGRTYVRIINAVHGRTGTLWEGRYKAALVATESYLLACHRYIECNPVRAGMAAHASKYPWSSHLHYAFGQANPMLTEHAVYLSLGPSAEERRSAFRGLFDAELATEELEHIRGATRSGAALGDAPLLERLSIELGRDVRIPSRGRPSKAEPASNAPQGVSGKLL